ncbi:MAG: hypothetical protein AAF772_04470, partial [Acidobacteriota bacterium]
AAPADWLLEIQPDARDKEIRKLKDEVRSLKSNRPVLNLSARYPEGEGIKITEYADFKPEEIEGFLKKARMLYPMEVDFNQALLSDLHQALYVNWTEPSGEEIKEYQESEYPRWLASLKEYYAKMPVRLSQATRYGHIELILRNDGKAPAENTIVEIEALGGFFLIRESNALLEIEYPRKSKPPKPPLPPQMKGPYQSLALSNQRGPDYSLGDYILPHQHQVLQREEIDRYLFYWWSGKNDFHSRKWEFECQDFRHNSAEEIFKVHLFIPSSFRKQRAAIRFRITASNLTEATEEIFPISVSRKTGDITSELKRAMKSIKDNGFE